MRQITKRLLSCSANVRIPKTDSVYGGEYEEPFCIEHIRYDRVASIRKTDYQLQDSTTGLVFIDAVNSQNARELPAGTLLSIEGASITGSLEVCVNACHVFETTLGRVHHWELEVQ